MFKKVRAKYAFDVFGRRRFPQVDRGLLTIDQIIENYDRVEKIVDRNTKVSSIGSCFAEEILLWMNKNDFNVIQPHWGMVYNPKNIRLIVQAGLEYESFSPSERFWDFGDNDIRTPYVKSSVELSPVRLGRSLSEAEANEKILFSKFGKVFREVETLIITLGQTEYWATEKDYPFYAAPWAGIKDGEKNHKPYNLSHAEVKEELSRTIDLLKKHNPEINILVSVSPVPLVATVQQGVSAYIAAGRAKSTLHSATLEVVEDYEKVFYMPSYEIVTSRPESSFKGDGRHVLGTTVSSIMETFKKLFT
jgi:hypothetical protein